MGRDDVKQFATTLLNIRKDEAVRRINQAGCIPRIIVEDGMHIAGASDFVANRINMEVIDGIVRSAEVG